MSGLLVNRKIGSGKEVVCCHGEKRSEATPARLVPCGCNRSVVIHDLSNQNMANQHPESMYQV